MATPTAGELEDRVRRWLTTYNSEKLTPEDIYSLMNEAGEQLVEMFDIWFCKTWGQRTRDADNAIWPTSSIPPPTDSLGAYLTAAQIAGGEVPANGAYLRALPYPDRLLRPESVYWGTISSDTQLPYLLEQKFEETYLFETSPGTPEAYSLSGDSMIFGPVPSFEATVWVQGFYKPEPLEASGDENEFTRYAHTLLVYATQNTLIKYNFEEEERGNLFQDDYNRALRAALSQSGRTFDNAHRSVSQRKG
jgi:hypothetical protein